MDDIDQQMHTKYDFVKRTESISDTQKVAQEPSTNIAIAYKDEEGAVADRYTVQNSMQLGGKEATDYVTADTIASSINIVNNCNDVYSQEILNLRDELYQMKEVLVKRGFVKDNLCYSGFQDNFLSDNKKYVHDKLTGSKVIAKVKTAVLQNDVTTFELDNPGEIGVGDWIIVYKPADEIYYLRSVLDKNAITDAITIDVGISNLDTDTEIYKTFGDYHRGSFVFAEVGPATVTAGDQFAAQVSDVDLENFQITASNAGYAVAVKIPDDSVGALSEFSIKGAAHGNAGDLFCFIIDSSDAALFQNYGTFLQAGKIVGSSNTIAASECLEEGEIEFSFTDPLTGEAPVLTNKSYYFVVECLNANLFGDHWTIKMSDMHNTVGVVTVPNYYATYKFAEQPYSEVITESAFTAPGTMSNFSMYFRVITNAVVEEEELPHEQGLYTTVFDMAEPMLASKVRLAVRVGREGNFKVTDMAGPCLPELHAYTFGLGAGAQYDMEYGSGINVGDTVVIGTTVAEVLTSVGQTLTIDKGMYLNENEMLYRMGLDVQVKASLKKCDATTGFQKTYENIHTNPAGKETPYKLNLVAVIPDGAFRENRIQSDRLLFEADFDKDEYDMPKYVNHFELQVKWNSNFKENQMAEAGNKDIIGRITSLNLVLDKAF
jgi:hypothetical protein